MAKVALLGFLVAMAVGCGGDPTDPEHPHDAPYEVIVQGTNTCTENRTCIYMTTPAQESTSRGQCREGRCVVQCEYWNRNCDGDPSNGCEVEADRCP